MFAQILVLLFLFYLVLGVLFAGWFVVFKIADFDDSAKSAGRGFRVIIFLGSILFWSVLLYKLVRGEKNQTERNAHRTASVDL